MATIEELADKLANRITGWEDNFLKKIGERIRIIGGMTPADAAALNNAADIQRSLRDLFSDLGFETQLTISQLEALYLQALRQAQKVNDPLFDYRGKKFPDVAKDPRWRSMVRAYAKNTAETFINIINTKMLCTIDASGKIVSLQQAYYDVLDKATVVVTSGTEDFNSAMRSSIQALGGNGVRVHYGSGITRRLDTVVRQNLLWVAKQAREQYQAEIGEELGCDGIEIDWHTNPRPSHAFMQGRQFAIGAAKTVNGVTYPSADDPNVNKEYMLSVNDALEDYNCYHYSTPVILGVSVPRYTDAELKKLNAENKQTYTIDGKTQSGYAWTQDMRKLESAIRKQKTTYEMAKAAGNTDLCSDCRKTITALMAKYDKICDGTGFPREDQRLSIARHLTK